MGIFNFLKTNLFFLYMSLYRTKCFKSFLDFVKLVDVVHIDPQHSHDAPRVLFDFPAHQRKPIFVP